jgi:hypothetical protein
MLDNEYPLLLEELAQVLKERENHLQRAEDIQWIIGDKCLEICPIGEDGIHNDSQRMMQKVSDDLLREHGLKYSVKTLTEYRDISNLYLATARAVAVSYTVHRVVRSSSLLTAIIAMPRAEDQELTEDYARRMVIQIEERNLAAFHKEREEELRKADEEMAAAKKQEHEAAEELKRAQDEEGKQKAETKKAEAEQKTKDAREKQKANRNIRPTREVKKTVPPKEVLSDIALFSELKGIALKAAKLAEDMRNILVEKGGNLHEDSKAALLDLSLEVHQDWLNIANNLRGTKPHKGNSHLSVIDNSSPAP